MNWKFWKWVVWKEDEFGPPPEPTIDPKNVNVLEDPVETPSKNPEADRIRQKLLANRK